MTVSVSTMNTMNRWVLVTRLRRAFRRDILSRMVFTGPKTALASDESA